MHRFFLKTAAAPGEVVSLDESDSYHASRVLRIELGKPVELLDGGGRRLFCRVVEVQKRATRVQVVEAHFHSRPPQVEIAPSLLKGKAMDFLVQKVTELGASRLWPLVSERSVVRLREGEGAERVEDWTRTAVEACKQCGNPWLPVIETPRTVSAFLRDRSPGGLVVASLRSDARRVGDLFAQGPRPEGSVTLVLGPEGDFTVAEEDALREAGARPISLGPLVLRAETAAIAGLALLQHELAVGAGVKAAPWRGEG